MKKKSPTRYAPETKALCLDLYLKENISLKEIADRTGVPLPTVKYWQGQGKWKAVRQKIEQERLEQSKAEVMALRRDNAAQVLRRHLDSSDALETTIMRMARAMNERINRMGSQYRFSVTDCRMVKDLSAALQAVSRVSGPAAGLDHKGSGGLPMEGNALVQINLHPSTRANRIR
jgi:transposase-like protein